MRWKGTVKRQVTEEIEIDYFFADNRAQASADLLKWADNAWAEDWRETDNKVIDYSLEALPDA